MLPRVVVLYGETGRGKTYAVQRFYDELCGQTARPVVGGLDATVAAGFGR